MWNVVDDDDDDNADDNKNCEGSQDEDNTMMLFATNMLVSDMYTKAGTMKAFDVVSLSDQDVKRWLHYDRKGRQFKGSLECQGGRSN